MSSSEDSVDPQPWRQPNAELYFQLSLITGVLFAVVIGVLAVRQSSKGAIDPITLLIFAIGLVGVPFAGWVRYHRPSIRLAGSELVVSEGFGSTRIAVPDIAEVPEGSIGKIVTRAGKSVRASALDVPMAAAEATRDRQEHRRETIRRLIGTIEIDS